MMFKIQNTFSEIILKMAIWSPGYLIKVYLTHNIAEIFCISNKNNREYWFAMLAIKISINSELINFYV